MKIFYQILFILLFISCQSSRLPKQEQITVDNFDVGKCYFTLQMDNLHENEPNVFQKSFILEAISPKFQQIESTYSCEELKAKMANDDYLRLQISKPCTTFLIENANLSEFTTSKNAKGYVYCLVEVPAKWKTIYKNELSSDSIKITTDSIVEFSRMVKTFVKKKPEKLNPNQLFFESSHWSKPKEAIARSCEGMGDQLVLRIKKALVKLGYDLPLNNIMDDETRAAIVDFQRKNDLKEGLLDVETLAKLGVEY